MTYRMAVVHRRDYLSEELPRLDLLELGLADNVLCKAGSHGTDYTLPAAISY
jgi:hypothetical protein